MADDAVAPQPESPEAHLLTRLTSALPPSDAFRDLQLIAQLSADDRRPLARQLLIRLLDQRSEYVEHEDFLSGLLGNHGLFPYAAFEALSLREAVAYEAHRPLDFPDPEVVFHQLQGEVYRELMEGNSVVLSAPTSFGKTLVLDALLAADRFSNVVVIVPTIALIDEIRRRLSRFSDRSKLLTHPSQHPASRNVVIMTQERFLQTRLSVPIDFFMIDEFYKLQPSESDAERAALLNQALKVFQPPESRAFRLGVALPGMW